MFSQLSIHQVDDFPNEGGDGAVTHRSSQADAMRQSVLNSLRRDDAGGIALVMAFALPILLMIVGGTLDYVQAVAQRERLQSIIDSATLAATRELSLADARRENVAAVVQEMVLKMLAGNQPDGPKPALSVSVSSDPLEVTVVAQQVTQPYFGGSFGLAATHLEVAAVARVIGRPNICALALDPSADGTLSLEKNALVTGRNCAVYSNSTHNNGLKSKNSASLTASLICTAGGKDGGPGNFMPQPLVDCPTFDDPLAQRPEPTPSACVGTGSGPTTVVNSTPLSPGTYCGGLVVKAGTHARLDPGIYVIKDGPLLVEDGASLTGSGVGFYLTGKGAVLMFSRGSSIDLQAASSGTMAGMLFFEARSQPTTNTHQILSDDARNLLGTI
jgi:Putative Flp pilus-assembly TadE/G-like